MAPNNYGGGDNDGFGHQGNPGDFGNRGGNMPAVGGRQMGGGPPNYGRMDVDNGNGPSYGPSGGGNYGGNRGFSGNEGYGGGPSRGDNPRDAPVGGPNLNSYGSSRGRNIGHPSKGGDMGANRNSMQMGGGNMGGPSRQSGGNAMDYGEGMNRGGSGNQMPYNRGGRSDNQMDNMNQSYCGGSGGGRPWSSGYHQSEMSGGGNYGGGSMSKGGGNNCNSGVYGGNQGFNNRPSTVNPPACYRSSGSRY